MHTSEEVALKRTYQEYCVAILVPSPMAIEVDRLFVDILGCKYGTVPGKIN